MRRRSRNRQWSLLLGAVLLVAAGRRGAGAASGASDQVLIWSSTGGGWRSMVAAMGFAHVFGRAGLLTAGSSEFTAVSSTSGSAWFVAQLFYSEAFFRRTVLAPSPAALGNFSRSWMRSYRGLFAGVPVDSTCGFGGSDEILLIERLLGDVCDIFAYFGGDWSNFTRAMLDQAATGYGDAGLAERRVDSANRVTALRSTDLMVQMDLAANSKVPPTSSAMSGGTMAYLGPASRNNTVYTTLVTMQYTVADDRTYFHKTGEDDLNVYNGPGSENFSLTDYRSFFLYPPSAAASLTIGAPGEATFAGKMRAPFGGAIPTVSQVAGPSSAALGALSGLVPSLMAQTTSATLYEMELGSSSGSWAQKLLRNAFLDGLEKLYDAPLLYDVAVCSQWPDPCTDLDGRFVDGGYTDAASLALAIGHYHRSGGDTSQVLKVILTNTNQLSPGDEFSSPVLVYFSNPSNRNVKPGGYIWPRGALPMPSPQIFGSVLDAATLQGLLEPIKATTLTTTVLRTTTIENPVYHVAAGQAVEILVVNLNADIPTALVGAEAVDAYAAPVADMGEALSASEELRTRVKAFAVAPEAHKTAASSASAGGGFRLVALLGLLAWAMASAL